VRVVVVGAHLSGLPLNHQLTERGAVFEKATRTAAHYRFFALSGTEPPKPGLIRVAHDGAHIACEVWQMPVAAYGSFVAGIPAPLGIGSIVLECGAVAQGFLCEAWAVATAQDITAFGGWRSYMATRKR
jgi:allophanate hydrolase